MYKNKKILGLITARGGSKSIPKKNIVPLLGKPLITYAIETAKGSKLLTRYIVSTDNEEIARVCRAHGAEVPFMRPAELATDTATSMQVAQHALAWVENKVPDTLFDYVMILQPTSPLRTVEDIDEAIRIAVDHDADSVMSMYELTDFSPEKIKKVNQESLVIEPYFKAEGKESAQRQMLPRAYKRNCAIYLTRAELIKQGDLFGTRSFAYIMPEDRSLDINKPFDLELAEFLIRRV